MKRTRLVLVVALVGLGLAFATGCSKKSPTKTAPKKPVFQVPDSVMFYTGTDNPNALLAELYGVATQVTPMVPDPKLMVGPLLQGRFSLLAPTAFDFNTPLRFVLFNPKTYGRDPSATVIGIKDAKSFEAVIPATDKAQNVDGNAWMYRRWAKAKYPVYINFVGKHVILTRHKDLFSQNKKFLTELLGQRFPGGGGAVARLEQVMAVFDAEFKQGLADAKKNIASSPAGLEAKRIEAMISFVESTAKEFKSMGARLDITKDGIKIGTNFTPKAKSELAKTIGTLKTGKHSLLEGAPKDSIAFLSVALETSSFQGLLEKYAGLFNTLLDTGSNQKAAAEAMKKYMDQIDGRMFMGAHGDPSGSGLAVSMVYGAKDGDKLRAALASAQALTKATPATATPMDLTTDFKKDAYQIDGKPVDVITLSSANPQMAALAMTGFNVQHLGYTKNQSFISYGPTAKDVLTKYIKGQYNGLQTSAGVQRAMKNAAPNAYAHAYFSPLGLMQRAKLGGMNPFAITLAGLKPQGGIAMSAGHEAGDVHFVLDIPTTVLKDGMAAFEKVKGTF